MRAVSIARDETGRLARPRDGGQAEVMRDWRSFMVFAEGGWGSGKSWVGGFKLAALHVHNAFRPEGDRWAATGCPSAMVGPTYGLADDLMLPKLTEALEAMGLSTQVRGTQGRRAVVVPELGTRRRPSLIHVRSAHRPERITGWEVGAAWGDEAARWPEDREDPLQDPFTQLLGRVRFPGSRLRQIVFTYTNEGDHTKVYEEARSGHADRALYRLRTRDNPSVRTFYDRMTRELPAHLQGQYLEGGAASLRGASLYPSFDELANLDPELVIDPRRPVDVAFDFNISPGMHVEIGQTIREADCLTTVHEIHRPRLDAATAARDAADLVRELCPGPDMDLPEVRVYGDATGGSEWAGTGQSCYELVVAAFRSRRIEPELMVPASNPPVVDRLNACNVALRDAGGRVHWLIHPRCERLVEDMRRLKYGPDGRPDKRERLRSHASDADGYRVHWVRPVHREAEDYADGGPRYGV